MAEYRHTHLPALCRGKRTGSGWDIHSYRGAPCHVRRTPARLDSRPRTPGLRCTRGSGHSSLCGRRHRAAPCTGPAARSGLPRASGRRLGASRGHPSQPGHRHQHHGAEVVRRAEVELRMLKLFDTGEFCVEDRAISMSL